VPRYRGCRARPLLTGRRGRQSSNITLEDHERLKRIFASKPAEVLAWFEAAQVTYLIELPAYRYLLEFEPGAAQRIVAVAALMGIAEMPTF
jgi:hypothetical protein